MSKKLTCLFSLILALVAFPLVTHAQFENLVLNPSFEEDEEILDDPNWVQWCTWGYESGLDSTVEIDEATYVDGTRSLRVEPTGGVNWYFIVLYTPLPFEVGTKYTASVWAMAEEEPPFGMKFKATDNSSEWGKRALS
jgi:hypothetical protein